MGASFKYEYVVINSCLQFTPQIYLHTNLGEPLALCHNILIYICVLPSQIELQWYKLPTNIIFAFRVWKNVRPHSGPDA